MKQILFVWVIVILIMSCVTNEEPLVSRIWEMQETGYYHFESNTPNNSGLVSYKGWSGFRMDAHTLTVEYTTYSGGRGFLFGIKVDTDENTSLPLFVVDYKGRYNFLNPETLNPLDDEWKTYDNFQTGSPVLLHARRESGKWNFLIEEELAGSFAGEFREARFGTVVFTTYAHDRGARTDFPREKILLEMRVLKEE